jgi:hypothetical protein
MTCTQRAPDRASGKVARISGVLSSLSGAAGLLLLPKCPLCVAAWLSAAGLGAGGASLIAPLLRPLSASFAIAALVSFVWAVRRASRATQPPVCCRRGRGLTFRD